MRTLSCVGDQYDAGRQCMGEHMAGPEDDATLLRQVSKDIRLSEGPAARPHLMKVVCEQRIEPGAISSKEGLNNSPPVGDNRASLPG